jgi:hypothetical protein
MLILKFKKVTCPLCKKNERFRNRTSAAKFLCRADVYLYESLFDDYFKLWVRNERSMCLLPRKTKIVIQYAKLH